MNMTQPPEENYAAPPPQPRPVAVSMPTAAPRMTYTILGITVVVYLLQLLTQVRSWLRSGDCDWARNPMRPSALDNYGAFSRPCCCTVSILHIGFNMYALYIIGIGLERRFGHGRFLLLYILSGFAGSVFSFLLSSADSIGASGAIFGLIGAEGIFLYQNRKLLGDQVKRGINNVIFIVVLNLFLGLSPGIDNWAHVGGLMGGLIFAWFAGPLWEVQGMAPNLHVEDQREPRDVIVGFTVVTIMFCTLAAIGMWFPFVQ